MQIGTVDQKRARANNAQLQYYRHHDIEPKRKVIEFQVDQDGLVPIGNLSRSTAETNLTNGDRLTGSEIKAGHFVPGQFLDVQAKT